MRKQRDGIDCVWEGRLKCEGGRSHGARPTQEANQQAGVMNNEIRVIWLREPINTLERVVALLGYSQSETICIYPS